MESKNDNVMLTLGIIVLLIAIMGTAMLEGEEASGGFVFNVFYTENSEGIFGAAGHTNEGEEETLAIDIAGPANMLTIEFILTWTDNDASEANVGGLGVQNQPDTFSLSVMMPDSPGGLKKTETNDVNTGSGIIIMNYTFQDFPEDVREVPSESNTTLEQELTTDFGIGNWTVIVTCEEAGDSETTTGQTADQDDGNDWNLDIVATYFTMEITDNDITIE